ncbi:MAG: hypothetical protein PHE53_06520 [Thermoguttaceae bacterium]|nr:hypothetical protein [Thermoguttaceae bacterium]
MNETSREDKTRHGVSSEAIGSRMIEVVLREPAIGTLVFGMTAVRSQPAALTPRESLYRTDAEIADGAKLLRWNFPAILPMGTESHSGVFGLVLEDLLEPYQLETEGLISLDTSLLERAIPASALAVQPGLPVVRSVAAFYVPIAGQYPESSETELTTGPLVPTAAESNAVSNTESNAAANISPTEESARKSAGEVGAEGANLLEDKNLPEDANLVAHQSESPQSRSVIWAFSTGFYKPTEELLTTVQVFVEPGTQGMTLRGDFSLLSTREKMFEAKIELPVGWNVTQVTDTSDANRPPLPLVFERLELDTAVSAERRVRLRILPPLSADGTTRKPIAEQTLWKISIDAVASAEMRIADRDDGKQGGDTPNISVASSGGPNVGDSDTGGSESDITGSSTGDSNAGEPNAEVGGSDERPYRFAIPEFRVCGATRESGAVAIGCRGDFSVRPEGDVASALIPLLDTEISSLGFRTEGVTPQLAWSYRQRTPLPRLVIEKVRSRSTARAFSFFRVGQDRIAVHQELVWKIDQAKTSRLRFALPASSPAGVTISSPDGTVAIRQYTSHVKSDGVISHGETNEGELADGERGSERIWDVETVNPVRGIARLVVNFSIPQSDISQTESTIQMLPLPTFPDAVHTSGLLAVEGDAELDTTVQTTARKIDIGELAEAESYLPGERLIGAWSFVAAPPVTRITMRRYPAFALVPAIAERLQLDLRMTDQVDGMLHAAAEFTLRTTPQTLLLELPMGAELYAIHLDDRAMRPIAAQADGMTMRKMPTFLVDVTSIGSAEEPASLENSSADGMVHGVPNDAADAGASVDDAAMELRVLRVMYGIPRSMCDETYANGTGSIGGVCERLKIAIPRMRLADGRVMPVLRANGRILPPEGTVILNPLFEMPTESYGFVETSRRLLRDIGKTLCAAGGTFMLSKTGTNATLPKEAMEASPGASKDSAEGNRKSAEISTKAEWSDGESPSRSTLEKKPIVDGLPAAGVPAASPPVLSMDTDGIEMDKNAAMEERDLSLAEKPQVVETSPMSTAAPVTADAPAEPSTEHLEEQKTEGYVEYGHARPSVDAAGRGRGPSEEPRPAQAVRESRALGIRSLPIQLAMDDERVIHMPLPTMAESQNGTDSACEAGCLTSRMTGAAETAGGGAVENGTVADIGSTLGGTADRTALPEMELLLVQNAGVRFGAIEWIVGLGVLLVGGTVLRRGYGAQVLMLVGLWCVAVFLPFVYQMYTLFVTHASDGILHAQSPDRTVLLRGVATAIAMATVLLLLVYLLRALGIFIQTTVAKLIAKSRSKCEKNIPDSTSENCAEGNQTMEMTIPKNVSGLRFRILLWALLVLFVMWLVSMFCSIVSAQEVELPPITIPDDAIIVPYDPDVTQMLRDEQGNLRFVRPAVDENQTILVPYTDYRSMRERVQKELERLRDLTKQPNAAASNGTATGGTVPNRTDAAKPLPNGVPIVKANGESQHGVLAIRHTEYRVRTETSDTLSVRGAFELEILADDGDLIVPMPVVGALVESVKVDGLAAPLVTLATTVPEPMAQQMANQAVANAAMPSVTPSASVGVRVKGRGVHPVELTLRFPVSRQGGVRVISGIVPIGAAAQLVIEVPTAGTTLSIGDESSENLLRDSRETRVDGEQIITSLDTAASGPVVVMTNVSGAPAMQCGRLRVQWRPRVVTDAPMDAGLTVDSLTVIDLAEDGTRLAWRATPSFRSGEYQQFRVEIPMEDLPDTQQWRVERVTGANVRVWDQRQDAQKIVVDVELLGAAKDSETFTVYLFQAASALRTVPIPAIQGALRHVGQVAIRKSPQMSLRTVRFTGVEQIDFPTIPDEMLASGETPLGVQNFQGYQFRSHPSSFTCETQRLETERVANVEMEWRVTPSEAVVDATIRVWMADEKFHDFTLELPPGLKIDTVSATGDPQWCVEPAPLAAKNEVMNTARRLVVENEKIPLDERKTIQERLAARLDRLVFRFARAQSGYVDVRLRGTLTQPTVTDVTAWVLPWFRLLDTEAPTAHTVVIQTDPAFETQWDSTRYAMFGTGAWRAADERQTSEQRSRLPVERATLMREVLVGSGCKVDGQWIPPLGIVRLTPREPIMDAVTISNIRLTDRDVEETVLIDLTIQRAGVREIVFELPERMSDARFQVPGLRRTVIEPVESVESAAPMKPTESGDLAKPMESVSTESTLAAQTSETHNSASSNVETEKKIRVRLELQDEVMGQVRVLVENDLPLAGEQREVVFPLLRMPTQTLRRFALIENSGRDEMVVVECQRLIPIDRRQEAWTRLVSLLGSEPVGAEAFTVVEKDSPEEGNTEGKLIPNEGKSVHENDVETSTTTDSENLTKPEDVAKSANATELTHSDQSTSATESVGVKSESRGSPALEPRLRIGTRRREQADWVDARIGLSETSLIVDAFGEYRARQIWSIDNSTRPLLEVELPAGATLWGVTVAGKPVKPIAVMENDQMGGMGGAAGGSTDSPISTATSHDVADHVSGGRESVRESKSAGLASSAPIVPGTRVRFPLVKTSQGDPDYEIVAIYAGKLPAVQPGLPWARWSERASFPLIRVHGIEVRRSNVKLFLPKNVRWFDFDGTLGQVDSEEELMAQRIEYDTDQLQRLMQKRRESGDRMTQIRAEENLRILAPQNRYRGTISDGSGEATFGMDSGASDSGMSGKYSKGLKLVEKAVQYNQEIVSQVEEELGKASQEAVVSQMVSVDNRQKFHDAFANQSAQRALNVVAGLGTEPAVAPPVSGAEMSAQSQETETWMKRNALESSSSAVSQPTSQPTSQSESTLDRKADETVSGDVSNGPMQKSETNRLAKSKAVQPQQVQQMVQSQMNVQNRASVLDVSKEMSDGKQDAQEESSRQTERYRGQVQQRAMSNRMNYVGNRGMESPSRDAAKMGRSDAENESLNASAPVQSPGESQEMLQGRGLHRRAVGNTLDGGMTEGTAGGMSRQGMSGFGGMSNGRMGNMDKMGGMSGGMGSMEGSGLTQTPTSAIGSPAGDLPSPEVPQQNVPGDDASSFVSGPPDAVPARSLRRYGGEELQERLESPSNPSVNASASQGLASLMISWDESELAADSQVVYFTTPGGDLTLETRGYPGETFELVPTIVTNGSLGVLKHLFWLLLAMVIFHRYRVRKTGRAGGEC